MTVSHDIPGRLLTSERARREAFTPIARGINRSRSSLDLDSLLLLAMEAGFQFAVGGADEAEKAAAASR